MKYLTIAGYICLLAFYGLCLYLAMDKAIQIWGEEVGVFFLYLFMALNTLFLFFALACINKDNQMFGLYKEWFQKDINGFSELTRKLGVLGDGIYTSNCYLTGTIHKLEKLINQQEQK